MEIDNNEALQNLLSAISNIERHYFINILNEASHREDFSIQKCNCCPNNNKFPSCFTATDPPYLNCYLHSFRTYLNVKYKLNWMTVTLFPPSIEDKIDNYNLGYDIENIEEFYSYFNGINYSASKAIFIDKHPEISKRFPSTDIFKMHYVYEKGLIEITDAINHSIVLPEQPSEDNFKKYTNIMSSVSGKKLNYLYFFIYKNFNPLKEKELFSGLYIPSDTEIIASYLKEISILTKIFLTPIEKTRSIILLNDEFKKKIRFSMKAASAAIMSRNGSHNIGSHVLSSVSQNFNEWTDDTFLFSYIQQRMDFIAQITTEVPEWHYPSLFIQDLMRRFYMQRHLLNYICSAEGLSAYEYQKRGEDNKYISSIYDATIKNKVIIKIVKNGKTIISPDNNDNVNSLNDVIQVAIPGGIIGQHAFYTILENILRNTAKHNWARNNQNPNNMELTICFVDMKDKDYILIKIWDNVSDVFKDPNESLSHDLLEERSKTLLNNDDSKKTYLHQSINAKLKKHFIDIQTGKLLNENWGLAEIKICAAYLNKKEISEVGINEENILFDSKNDIGFISTVGHEDKGIYRLCYQFPIPKPKELLICGVASELLNHNEQSEALSVHFDIKVPSRIDYEFIVFTNPQDVCDKYSDIYEKELFPFRLVLISSEIPDSCLSIIEKLVNKRRLVFVKEDIKTYLGKYNKGKYKYDWDGLKINIYVDWLLKYYGNKLKDKDALSLYVQLDGTSEGIQRSSIESFLGSLSVNNNCKEEIKRILNKDEECIETMPVIFKAKDKVENGKHDNETKRIFIVDKLRSEVKKLCNYSNTKNGSDIIIMRHSQIEHPDEKGNNKYIYQEALSGSQIYYNIFESSSSEYFKNKFTLLLVENALLNIKVADERFAKYYLNFGLDRDRFTTGGKICPIFKFKYNGLERKTLVSDEEIRIYNNSQKISKYKAAEYLDIDFNSNSDYDVLIIHQTLLDEYFENNRGAMEVFITTLKDRGVNVVVTSGRGKPDKLPGNAKFVPFSNLESSLFKSYPEKILLTQTIMSIHRKKQVKNEL